MAQRSGADVAKAIAGQIDTFTDAHTGVAQQQEDVGRQIVAAEQLLLDALILLRRQGAGQALRRPRRILATDQMSQIGKLCGPGKFLQNAPQTHEARDIDGRRQVRSAGGRTSRGYADRGATDLTNEQQDDLSPR